MESGAYADMSARNLILNILRDGHEQVEAFRFTIADNPGLIEDASNNVGLGHSFLQSMERSHALNYVVDPLICTLTDSFIASFASLAKS